MNRVGFKPISDFSLIKAAGTLNALGKGLHPGIAKAKIQRIPVQIVFFFDVGIKFVVSGIVQLVVQ